jgi:hypothetical protein
VQERFEVLIMRLESAICTSEGGGLLKINPENEDGEERLLNCGIVTTP